MKKSLIVLSFLIFFFGCNNFNPIEVSRESIGKIINVEYGIIRTQIKTELMVMVIDGLPSIRLRTEAFKIIYSNKTEYFIHQGSNKKYRILGNQ